MKFSQKSNKIPRPVALFAALALELSKNSLKKLNE